MAASAAARLRAALEQPLEAWKDVCWREGSNSPLSSRFAALRLRLASRGWKRTEPHPEEWLLIEWPKGESEPTKYWLSTLPAGTPIETLVDTAKLRWRIERDYQDLKQELGLGHYVRRRLTFILGQTLQRCPCCARPMPDR
ncbi:MAG: family transposase [Rhodospirillales bacterium]|nr:family transposase [Rhodospirillales bacterium]